MINRYHFVYLPIFLIPFVVRLLPELRSEYVLGADTPIYMYAMKYALVTAYEKTNVFHLMIRELGSIGVDSTLFFKTYPPVMFALICALLAMYARRALGWDNKSLVIFSLVYSFTPALLRVSWTLQREVFAIFLFALALVVDGLKMRREIRWVSISLLYILIAFTHEFIFAVAAVILVLRTLRVYHRRTERTNLLIPIIIIAIGILVYTLVRVDLVWGLLSAVYTYHYHPEGVVFSGPWQGFDWWLSVGLISLGFLIPIALLGFFVDDTMTLWFLVTIIPYASFAISYLSFNQPERWLYLASIPISFYAANFARKLDSRKLSLYGILAILAIQPFSMIGAMPLPLSVYADKRYGTFSDALNPSIPSEQIRALQMFQDKASTLPTRPSLVIVPRNFSFMAWAQFYFPQATVYYSDSSQARSLIDSGQHLLYITYVGKPPSTNRTSIALISYGGLYLYLLD